MHNEMTILRAAYSSRDKEQMHRAMNAIEARLMSNHVDLRNLRMRASDLEAALEQARALNVEYRSRSWLRITCERAWGIVVGAVDWLSFRMLRAVAALENVDAHVKRVEKELA